MIHFGMVRPGSTLRIPFDTFAASTGAPTALSSFAVGDILVYKDGNTTARASTTGYTATTTFSSITGINEAVIDLSSDAEADFFKSGSHYVVVISPVTADGQTLAFVAATFSIGYSNALLNTSIATLSSQTSFTLTSGPAEDDALNGMYIVIHDKASAVQTTWAIIEDYTGSTKTVTLAATPAATFTIAAIDNVAVFGPMPLQSTVHGRKLDVSTGGEAGVDWANVGSPTTSLALTGTTIATTQKVDVETIKTNPVVNGGTITFPTGATLASTTNITAGTVTTATNVTTVNGLAANVITAASMAADASGEIADAVWDEDATAHQTQGTFGQAIGDPEADTNTIFKAVVTDAAGATVGVDVVAVKAVVDAILVDTAEIGAAGAGLTNINLPDQTMNITGDITGNISGSVGSVTALAANAITATAIAADAIGASELASDAVTEIRSVANGTSDSGSTTTMVDAARTEADTDYWKGSLIVFTSGTIAGQSRYITAFDPATDTITFAPATTQAVSTQTYEIWPTADFLRPTVSGRTLDVSAGGEGGVDWANVGSPTTTLNLSGTTVKTATDVETDTQDIQSRLPAALTAGGKIPASMDEILAVGQSATDLKDFADDGYDPGTNKVQGVVLVDTVTTYTGNTPQTGDSFARLGAPAGASVSADIAAIEAQTDDIGTAGAGLTAVPWNAAWDAEVQSEVDDALVARSLDKLVIVSGTADSGSTTTMVDAARTEADADYWKGRLIVFTSGDLIGQCAIITDFNAGTDTITFAPAVTQAVSTHTYVILPWMSVWDDTLAEHLSAGTTGNALNAAGAAGDPWATALPGAYGAGTAGKIVGDNINATVSSRATQTSVDDLPTNAELATALGTADDAVLAQVALVKAQTDLIPAAPASTTNITAGTITTVTNLTNAPTNGDLTAVMKASVNAEVDTALSDYDGPTNAELATALGTADDAVLAAIAALNNIAAGAAMTLTTGERDAIAAAILDLANGIEAGLTLRQAQRLEVAALAGKLSGAATATVTIRNAVADSKNRIVATVDNDGNRSAITTDLT